MYVDSESDQVYKLIFESSLDAILLINPDGLILTANPKATEIFGYSEEELIKLGRSGIVDNKDPKLPTILEEIRLKGKAKGELKLIRKNREKFLAVISSHIFKDEKGNERTIMIIRDISDRLLAEENLKENEQRYSIILDAVNDGLWEWNVASGDAFFSPNYYKLLGYKPGEFSANYASWRLLVYPDEIDSIEKQLQESIESGKGFEIDFRMKNKSGKWLWVSTRGKAIKKDSKGIATRMVGTLSNITDRKKTEEKIQWLANVVNSSDDAIITKSLDGIITTWNKGAEIIYGYSAEEVIGKNISILVPLPLKNEIKQLIEKIKNGKKIVHYETVGIHKNGQRLDVSVNLSPIFDKSGNLIGISTITRDITNSKKVESALIESEEKFREVFNNANDAMFLHKLEGRNPGNFIEVNDVACQILGYSRNELLNMSPIDIDTHETVAQTPKIIENLLNKGKTTFEAVQVTKDGELLPVEINTHLFTIRGEEYILSISRDIRERKKAEDSLRKSESKYRTIFENVQDIFYQTSLEGNIIEINPSIERYSGYKPAELIGKPVETVYLNP